MGLYERYQSEIRPELQKQLEVSNVMDIPRVEKVVLNIGIGSFLQNLGKKNFDFVLDNMQKISGQKPVVRNAKVSVSNFKLREGSPVGVCVTLRGESAYNFLDKVINVAYPRVRDFQGVKEGIFDKFGNCSFGFNNHTVFPEVAQPENLKEIHGLQVTVVSTAKDAVGARALMDAFKFPFIKKDK